jgi:prepilin-type N-terminal cleavage/methylation domain-containing protein
MRSQKGFSLIDVLVSMAIIGIVGVGLLSAMTTSSRAAIATDQMDTARVLAQSQMEYVKRLDFSSSGTYTPQAISSTDYPGYAAIITAAPAAERDGNIQKITVTITRNGNTITTLQDCKAKR